MRRRTHDRKFVRSLALAAAAALPLAACNGDDPVAPGEDAVGTMEVAVRDDPGGSGAAGMSAASAGQLSGEFRGNARIQVEVDGEWQDLSGLTNVEMSAELQSGEQTAASASVEARTYPRARIVLTNARADVDAGSQIGIGPISVDISITIGGGGDVIVEHSAPLTVSANGTTKLVLVLNSHAWLDQQAAEAQAVSRAQFESAAQIAVQ